MNRFLIFGCVLLACAPPPPTTTPGSDAGTSEDAGSLIDGGVSPDGGTLPDAGGGPCTQDTDCAAGLICTAGSCVAGCTTEHACADALECCGGACVNTQTDVDHCGSCSAPVCATQCQAGACQVTSASVDLFELSGTVDVGGIVGNVSVQVLAPYVAIVHGAPPVHQYDDRQAGLGCYADHYNLASDPPTPDANAGPVRITGYAGGKFIANNQTASSEMNCAIVSGNYQCGFGALSNGQPGASAAGQAFKSNTNPLGAGQITFSDATNQILGTFSVTGSASGTVAVSNLTSQHYVSAQSATLNYSCTPGSCASHLILVTLAATQNTGTNLAGSSSSFGAVTCAAVGGTSITVPAAAVTAMLASDSSLKTVLTSVVVAEPSATPAQDSEGHSVTVVVGRGVFGISTL